jgi:hypothetical protein
MFKEGGKTIIVMPWDSTYESMPGEGIALGQHYEPALLALPSRVELDR